MHCHLTPTPLLFILDHPLPHPTSCQGSTSTLSKTKAGSGFLWRAGWTPSHWLPPSPSMRGRQVLVPPGSPSPHRPHLTAHPSRNQAPLTDHQRQLSLLTAHRKLILSPPMVLQRLQPPHPTLLLNRKHLCPPTALQR